MHSTVCNHDCCCGDRVARDRDVARNMIAELQRLPPCGRTIHERAQVLQVLYDARDNGTKVKQEWILRARRLLVPLSAHKVFPCGQ